MESTQEIVQVCSYLIYLQIWSFRMSVPEREKGVTPFEGRNPMHHCNDLKCIRTKPCCLRH